MKQEYERIQKFLASRGIASRRQIEVWIEEGRLRVNGKPAEIGQRVSGHESFSLDGRTLRVAAEQELPRMVLMYHKPVGEICTRKDEEGRPTVFRRLPRIHQGRWVAIGRLDINTAGLLLFTNDGALANKLMHPSTEIEREYWVRVAGEVNEETLQALRKGMMLEDGFAKFDDIQPLQALNDDDTQYNRYYSVVLKEGRNREVRRLWEAVGCQVSRLKRIRYGNVSLPKSLPAGKHRLLEPRELSDLMALVRTKPMRDKMPRPR